MTASTRERRAATAPAGGTETRSISSPAPRHAYAMTRAEIKAASSRVVPPHPLRLGHPPIDVISPAHPAGRGQCAPG